MFEVSFNEARDAAIRQIVAGNVPLFKGGPGTGKSAMAAAVAKMGNLKMIDLRLSMMTEVDFMGIPFREGERARFLPFSTLFPLVDTPIPDGYDGWLLFLDEVTSITKPVEAALYKLVYDRMVGEQHLNPNVYIMAAGNRETDKAVARKLGTALSSRMIHYTMKTDHKGVLDHFVRSNFDYRITGFLEFKEDLLNNFDPEADAETFACSRTWEFMTKTIKDVPTEEIFPADVAGTIGQGAAIEFLEYIKEYTRLPRYVDIVANPTSVPIPVEPSTRFAVVSMLLSKVSPKDFEDVVQYVDRLSPEFQVIFFRGVGTRFPAFKRDKAFRKATKNLTEFLYADDSSTPAAQAA
jgi:hypothetical protein